MITAAKIAAPPTGQLQYIRYYAVANNFQILYYIAECKYNAQ